MMPLIRQSPGLNRHLLRIWTYLCLGAALAIATPVLSEAQESPKPPPAAESRSDGGQRYVSIDFNDVDISVFIKFISELTGKNFVIDQRVRSKVTIISPAKISIAEAYKVFESVLEVHGFATVDAGDVIKIVPAADARSKSIETKLSEARLSQDDRIITQLIRLKYADPDEVKRLFTPLISKSSVILSYAPTNTLIITDAESNLKRLSRLLEAIDVTGTGRKITVLPVEYADATKLVSILSTVFKMDQRPQRGSPSAPLTFISDERTNSIVLLAGEGETEHVKRLVSLLDKETPRGKGNINVYYLEHANAEDVVSVLQNIPQKGADTEPGKKTAPVVSDKVRITADKATNSLIITADKEDYEVLEDIIRKIDIPRAMVYIESLIMEVNVKKEFRLGTEWQVGDDTKYNNREAVYGGGFTGEGLINYDSSLATATAGVTPVLPSGMSLGLFGETLNIGGITFPSVAAVARAYQTDSDVNILSTPQILTTDNQEAKITVGRNVPFQTTTTTTNTETYNSFEYRDVGKTLKITPQISKGRMVRLNISLEVTTLEDATDNRPTTLKRTVDTTVIVQDRHTVVLGGLIDDKDSNAVNKVPCLGDVPGFGWLFKSDRKGGSKDNLYIFLTPRVIKNPAEADDVYQGKRNHIDSLRGGEVDLFDNETKPAQKKVILEEPAPGNNEAPTTENQKGDDLPPAESPKPLTPQSALEASPAPEPSSAGEIDPSVRNQTSQTEPAQAASPDDTAGHSPQVQAAASKTIRPTAGSVSEADRPWFFTLQAASFKTHQRAQNKVQQLQPITDYNVYLDQGEFDGKTWYRVRLGRFNNRLDAVVAQAELSEKGISSLIIMDR